MPVFFLEHWRNSQPVINPVKSVETILDAADTNVRATILQQILKLALMG
jgi:hypothetical protein